MPLTILRSPTLAQSRVVWTQWRLLRLRNPLAVRPRPRPQATPLPMTFFTLLVQHLACLRRERVVAIARNYSCLEKRGVLFHVIIF